MWIFFKIYKVLLKYRQEDMYSFYKQMQKKEQSLQTTYKQSSVIWFH